MIITFTSQKGGVTKTTSTVHLGYALAQTGVTVLIADLDPQGQCATVLGRDPGPGLFNYMLAEMSVAACAQTTGRKRLLLLPGSQKTKVLVGALQAQLNSRDITLAEIAGQLRRLGEEVDYVIFDTPAAGLLQEVAVVAADVVIAPTSLDYLAMEGVAAALGMIAALRPQGVTTAILPVLLDGRISEHRTRLGALQEAYGARVCEVIPRRAGVSEATSEGKLIFETEPRNDAALAYTRLAEKIAAYTQMGVTNGH